MISKMKEDIDPCDRDFDRYRDRKLEDVELEDTHNKGEEECKRNLNP